MCAPVSVVPAGKPVNDTLKSAVAAVMVPEALRVRFKVIVTRPDPDASAFDTAGTSLNGDSPAISLTSLPVGEFGLSSSPHAGELCYNLRPCACEPC